MTESTNTVERTVSILEEVGQSENGLSNSDLSRRLKIPKSSASYILRVLEKRGYLLRDDGGKYRLGLKLVTLTRGALTHLDVREVAKPVLERFLQKSRLSEAHLAVLDNGRAVYVEKVETPNSFIKMDIWVGHRLPVHTTAIGKALVAHLPESEILQILELRGMEKKTRKSMTNPQKFLRELEKVRTYGFAVDDEENADGVRCVASPVFDAAGKTVASLGTSTVIMQLDETHLPKIVKLIQAAAATVSEKMGFQKKLAKSV